jgi:hypothetical protein
MVASGAHTSPLANQKLIGADVLVAQLGVSHSEPKPMFTLDQVVPWGRSFDEYQRMFSLTDTDLGLTILGCGDGPASFNAEATRRGATVVSCDPIYRYDSDQLRGRVGATYAEVLDQTRRNADEFVWNTIRSVDELGQVRMAAMNEFMDDYAAGKTEGRYVDAELPNLPFRESSFDLALCSHFLFLYTNHLGEAFHRSAIREMCRVAVEVRIFPLLALGATPLTIGEADGRRTQGGRLQRLDRKCSIRISAWGQSDDADSENHERWLTSLIVVFWTSLGAEGGEQT